MSACPNCQAACAEGDRFCADCGARLPSPATSASALEPTRCVCGSTEFDADGFCVVCGVKARPPPDDSGAMVVGPGLAAFSDAGLVHERNEDSCALAGPAGGGAGTILVVCDGVSNSQAPDIASAAAAHAALEAIRDALANGATAEQAVRDAILRAHEAVCAVPYDRQDPVDPPASTIVVAHLAAADGVGATATLGWLGDSRAYWIARESGKLLTRDHSWRNLVVDRGDMTDETARRDKLAHALVKCLGSTDFSAPTPCPEPSVTTVTLDGAGWLLACTDGLWNYAETPSALAGAAQGAFWSEDAVGICRRLVTFARERGGHDNITAAMSLVTLP
jgi:serine/threonine protein phosphatase PrpC